MALEQVGIQFIAAGGDVYISTLDKSTKATNTFVSATESGGGRISGAGQIMIGALRKVGAVAVEAFGQALRATAAFVGDSISVAGDFEQGMHKFQAVAGDAVDTKGLEKFKDLFISLGKELPVSTSEVEQAAIEMVSGGIDPAIVAGGALRSTIQFAAASGLSLADAAATSAKFLAGWTSSAATTAEKVDFLTSSTDALTKAAAASSTTAAELRLGIFNVQGAAQALHAPFEDVVASLALLAPAFESSAQAGTALNVFMSRLVPQTDKAAGVMNELGLITKSGQNVFFDTQGNFLGMANAAEILKGKISGMNDMNRTYYLQELFGNDAKKVANLLMQDGAAGIDAMKAKMDAANGVSATAALMQSGYNTALENAKGSVEAFQIRIGSFLIPVLTDLLNNNIAPAINSITSFAEAFLKMVPAIAASDDPLQTFLLAIAVAAPGLTDFAFSLIHIKDGFVAFLDKAKPVTDFIGANLTPILFGIGTAITVAVLPALLAATGAFLAAAAPIVALVAAGALLFKAWTEDWGGIQGKTAAVWAFLEPVFTQAVDWLQVTIPKAIKVVSDYWTGTLVPALKVAGAFFEDHIFPVLKDLATVWLAAAEIEVKALATLWTTVLQPALKAVWDFISGSVIPIFKALFEVNWAIATKAVEALAGLWQKVLQPALKTVGDYINDTVIPAFKSIGDYLSATFGPTLKDVGKWLDDVTGGFTGVSGGVKDVIKWLGDLATSISTLKLPDWLTPGSPTPWETALYGIGGALQKSVGPGLATMKQGMRDIGQEITDTFANTDIIDALTNLGEDAMAGFSQGLKDGFRGTVRYIESTATNVKDAFKDAFGAHSPATELMPVGASVVEGIMSGMGSMVPALIGLVNQTGSDMIAALTKNIDEGGTAIIEQMDKLTEDVKAVSANIQAAIGDAFGATASIDRQKVSNIKAVGELSPAQQAGVQSQINAAEQIARAMNDPQQAAQYFALRSKQLLELGKLQQQINTATDMQQRGMLQAQYDLINDAQGAELKQNAARVAQGSQTQDIADQVRKLLANNMLPGLLESPVMAQFFSLLGQLTAPAAATTYNGVGGISNFSQTTYNSMPVYTNNSPEALQQSFAVMNAGMI